MDPKKILEEMKGMVGPSKFPNFWERLPEWLEQITAATKIELKDMGFEITVFVSDQEVGRVNVVQEDPRSFRIEESTPRQPGEKGDIWLGINFVTVSELDAFQHLFDRVIDQLLAL